MKIRTQNSWVGLAFIIEDQRVTIFVQCAVCKMQIPQCSGKREAYITIQMTFGICQNKATRRQPPILRDIIIFGIEGGYFPMALQTHSQKHRNRVRWKALLQQLTESFLSQMFVEVLATHWDVRRYCCEFVKFLYTKST